MSLLVNSPQEARNPNDIEYVHYREEGRIVSVHCREEGCIGLYLPLRQLVLTMYKSILPW